MPPSVGYTPSAKAKDLGVVGIAGVAQGLGAIPALGELPAQQQEDGDGVEWAPSPGRGPAQALGQHGPRGDQGRGMQLAHPLAAQAQHRADLLVGGWGLARQTIAADDDVAQPGRGESGYQVIEHHPEAGRFPDLGWVLNCCAVRGVRWRRGGRAVIDLDRAPHRPLNRRPSIGRERHAALGIVHRTLRVAADGTPETEPPGLHRLRKGQLAQDLAPHHGLDQSVVRGHQAVQAVPAVRLGLVKQTGLSSGPTGASRQGDR